MADVLGLAMAGRINVSKSAYLVLLAMSAAVRDTASDVPEHLYFGGWPWLAGAALMRHKYDRAAEMAVWRAIRELRDAGLVVDRGRLSGSQSHAIYEVVIPKTYGPN